VFFIFGNLVLPDFQHKSDADHYFSPFFGGLRKSFRESN
jgi:hypothetical protein